MQFNGSQLIHASGDRVWKALNDPEILKQCLPGCESVTSEQPDVFKIVMTAAVGPLKAKFNGLLRITEAEPPRACVMVFEGQGGAMGFGKGSSSVTLRQVDGGTQLDYTAQAQLGGKLAQVGSRLIDSVARKMSDDFFARFRERLAPSAEATTATAANKALQAPERPEPVTEGQPASARIERLLPVREPMIATVPAWWLFLAFAIGSAFAIVASRIGS